MKKGNLAGKILGIVLILIVAGIMEVIFGSYILAYYKRQNEQLEDNIAEAFLTEKSQIFYYLNDYLTYMMYNGTEFDKVTEAYAQYAETVPQVLERTSSVKELKDIFRRLMNTYGKELNFFYFDKETNQMVEIGNTEYNDRMEFLDYVLTDIDMGELPYSKGKKWFLYQGNYICTIVRGVQGYVGCWMLASDFTNGIMTMETENCTLVEVYDKDTGTSFVQQRQKNGMITTFAEEKEKENGKWKKLHYASFEVKMEFEEPFFTGKLLLQLIFTLLMIIYLVIVVGVLLYVKRHILGQVNYFYENLLQFSDKMRFQEESGIVEFAAAGKVLNQLADEINRLKIDVYEEQLEKQKVELDYAQLQVRPHFYINCLNVIYSMAETGRTKEIQEVTIQVSKYLRYIFKKSMKPVTLKSELDFVENYLKVQTSMNGLPFVLTMDIEEGLEEFELPPLMVQTFVENSIQHGADMEKEFCVEIRALYEIRAEGRFVKIMVEDSGNGIPQDICDHMNRGEIQEVDESYQVGIRNAIKRMVMLYGEKASIQFGRSQHGGAQVVMYFPIDEG